ncbi:MAG: hypothetical protein AAFO57_00325 [Pseudomonadota bacterium]
MEPLATGHWLADESGDVVHARLFPDVRLEVTGFATEEERHAAARWIAERLNQPIHAPADGMPERLYMGPDGATSASSPDATEYVRADIAATFSPTADQFAESINEMAAKHQAERERIVAALQVEAQIAVNPSAYAGMSRAVCYQRGLHAGGDATREAIKAAVQRAMEEQE